MKKRNNIIYVIIIVIILTASTLFSVLCNKVTEKMIRSKAETIEQNVDEADEPPEANETE